ncbi:MAG: LysE family translocator [Nitrospiraceae bacterium]|nr:LysE family translocator [Nitrospiraceae bacterium]
MTGCSQIVLFLTGAFVIIVIPGPNILYLVTRSMHQGRAAGFASLLGIEAATIVHILAATLGLTSLLLSSVAAFTTVKYAGAMYLIYLGMEKLRKPHEKPVDSRAPAVGLKRVFGEAFFVNLLNPKTAMFFLAYLPQFMDVHRGNAAVQIISYGLLLIVLAIVVESVYVLFASRIGAWLPENSRVIGRGRFLAGGAYIGLGVTTALSGTGSR